jgi:hypothetical protein
MTTGRQAEFDHLLVFVDDPVLLRDSLARDWGLHVHADTTQFGDGVANLIVPLEPPQYLEILYVHDRPRFEQTGDQAFLDRLRAGGGLGAWALRTRDLPAIESALGQERDAVEPNLLADGSIPPWSTVSQPGDPLGYPFYIEYAAGADDRLARWRQRLEEVAHRDPVSGIRSVQVSTSDPDDLKGWLAPAADLDIRVVAGPPSLRATILIGDREMVLHSGQPGGIPQRL